MNTDKKIEELNDTSSEAWKDFDDAKDRYEAAKVVYEALNSAARNAVVSAANKVMSKVSTDYAISTVYRVYAKTKSITDAAGTAVDEAWNARETARENACEADREADREAAKEVINETRETK